MKAFKLIRDKIPEIMKNEGKNPTFYVADEKKFYKLLRNKLQEEVTEFLESNSIEELADILEVMYALCTTKGITMENLERIRLEKRKKRGAFIKRFVLEQTK